MTKEKTTKKGTSDPHTNSETEQLKDQVDPSSNASAAGDANEDKKTEVKGDDSTHEGDGPVQDDEGGGSLSVRAGSLPTPPRPRRLTPNFAPCPPSRRLTPIFAPPQFSPVRRRLDA